MAKQIREKKHRLPREHYCGQVITSFTACIANRNTPFTMLATVDSFIAILRSITVKYTCSVIYCFMPDHAHIIIFGNTIESDTYIAMVIFKVQSGAWFNIHLNEYKWQKDFHDHILRDDEDIDEHVLYVVNNPVRKGLVKTWIEYPFTGAIGIDLKTTVANSIRVTTF